MKCWWWAEKARIGKSWELQRHNQMLVEGTLGFENRRGRQKDLLMALLRELIHSLRSIFAGYLLKQNSAASCRFRKQELSFSLLNTFCSQTLINVTGELDLCLEKTVALLYRLKHPQTTCHSSQLGEDWCPENPPVQNSKANNSPSCPDCLIFILDLCSAPPSGDKFQFLLIWSIFEPNMEVLI